MNKEISVLYVDDENINTFVFERMMADYFTVITANTGEEGLNLLRNSAGTVSAVISDMRMPGMDGLTFIKKAKQEFPSLPFYLLTAYTDQAEIAEALSSKLIEACLNKPIEPGLISQEVLKHIN
jgi:response regulator RpfG family c-di-GMP phosphodiesterase